MHLSDNLHCHMSILQNQFLILQNLTKHPYSYTRLHTLITQRAKKKYACIYNDIHAKRFYWMVLILHASWKIWLTSQKQLVIATTTSLTARFPHQCFKSLMRTYGLVNTKHGTLYHKQLSTGIEVARVLMTSRCSREEISSHFLGRRSAVSVPPIVAYVTGWGRNCSYKSSIII